MRKHQCSFVPTDENHRRLKLASELGLNVTMIINDLLTRHLKDAIEDKLKTAHRLLAANGK